MNKFLIFIAFVTLTGCYSRRVAQKQFGKAAITYPELPADYCARVYPTKDSIIQGKNIIQTDTLWADDASVIRDTIRSRDTIWINTVHQMPGKIITNTILRTDSVFQTNTAAVDLCAIERRNAIALATDKTKEADKWRAIAKKRFWLLLGLGAAMALGVFAIVKKRIAKKIPV